MRSTKQNWISKLLQNTNNTKINHMFSDVLKVKHPLIRMRWSTCPNLHAYTTKNLEIFYGFLHSSEAATAGVLRKKVFLKISQNSQENTRARASF